MTDDLFPEEQALRPKLTDEFLATLVDAAVAIGLYGNEVDDLLRYCFRVAGKPLSEDDWKAIEQRR